MTRASKLLTLIPCVVCVIGATTNAYSQTNIWQATLHAEGQIIGGAVHSSDVVFGLGANDNTIPAPPAPPEYTVLTQLWRSGWIGPYYQDIYQQGQTNYEWLLDINPHGNVSPPSSRCATLSWTPGQLSSIGSYSLLDTFHTVIISDMRQTTQYQVCGNNQSQYFIVSYSLNRAPVLNPIGSRTVLENQLLTFADTATDIDGTIPTMSADSLPSGASFIDNHNGTGSFSWTPTFAQAGIYHVRFFASDGTLADTERVQITVTDVDRAPVLNPIGSRTVLENQLLTFADTATDIDGTIPTMSADSLPSGASFIDNHNGTGSFSWTPTFAQAGIYHVRFFASDGTLADTERVQITVNPDAIWENSEIPIEYSLDTNYPNPFNPATTIKFGLPKPSQVMIEIYDILGRIVDSPLHEEMPAGYHQIIWNSNNLPSGIYFYRIQAGEFIQTRKMLLLK